MSGYGYPHQHTGEQYQLCDVSVLVEAGCKACCNGKRAFFEMKSREIRAHIPDDMEIETFIHGAMCISYSGRCLLSSYYGRTRCKPAERVHIHAVGSMLLWKNPDRASICRFTKMNAERIFLIPRILCMIEHIPELIEAGIDSFKIEGRMKTALYVATVARTYRLAIDELFTGP